MATGFKDNVASSIRQLLELDESRRRATLESLSRYELRDINSAGGDVPVEKQSPGTTGTPTLQSQGKDVEGSKMLRPEQLEPAVIELPPGLYNTGSELNAEAAAYTPKKPAKAPISLQMDFTKALAASKLDEEAALGDSDSSTRYGEADTDTPLSRGATPPFSKGQESRQGVTTDARPEARNLAPLLEKALNNMPQNLPPEAASEARRVLSVILEQANSAKPPAQGQDSEAARWLFQHLAKQQEASMRKLANIFGANQAAAMSGQGRFPGGVMANQPVLPPGLGTPGGLAGMQMPWGRMDARMAACLNDPSYMQMAGGCPPWWGAMPGAPVAPAAPTRPQRQTAAQRPAQAPQGCAPNSPMANTGCSDGGSSAQPTGETLRMHLRSLIKIDSNRILIVRKINRLGFASPDLLEQHYSWYGKVERVLVAHSRVKSSALTAQMGKQLTSRLRPSGLGFVVMSKPEEAEAILADGPEQIVCGALIRVQQFERRMTEMEEGMENDHDPEELDLQVHSLEEQSM